MCTFVYNSTYNKKYVIAAKVSYVYFLIHPVVVADSGCRDN